MSKMSREFTKAFSLDQICGDLGPIHVTFICIFMHNECMQVYVMVPLIKNLNLGGVSITPLPKYLLGISGSILYNFTMPG